MTKAEQYYPQPARDDLAFVMFAAWLNCPPDKVPLSFKAWTCPATRAAWGRVAKAAMEEAAKVAMFNHRQDYPWTCRDFADGYEVAQADIASAVRAKAEA